MRRGLIELLAHWLLCGAFGVATGYLVTHRLPLPDSARSLAWLLVSVAATAGVLWLYRDRRWE